jgi:hypothetical protein
MCDCAGVVQPVDGCASEAGAERERERTLPLLEEAWNLATEYDGCDTVRACAGQVGWWMQDVLC